MSVNIYNQSLVSGILWPSEFSFNTPRGSYTLLILNCEKAITIKSNKIITTPNFIMKAVKRVKKTQKRITVHKTNNFNTFNTF